MNRECSERQCSVGQPCQCSYSAHSCVPRYFFRNSANRFERVRTGPNESRTAHRHELVLATTPLSPAPAWLRNTLPQEARANNALGQQSAGGGLAPMGAVASAARHPARPSHHCDAQGAQGVKGPSPELAWSPQVGSYLTVCTCGREPSWDSRYTQQRRRWRKPPTNQQSICIYVHCR